MKHAPITRQRSPWVLAGAIQFAGSLADHAERCVHDGLLTALVAEEPRGWHLSISHHGPNGDYRRYPSWDEIMHARQELLPAGVAFVMHLPVDDEYVALHPTTFHLHEHPERVR